MSVVINDETVSQWSEVLQNAGAGDNVIVSNEVISGNAVDNDSANPAQKVTYVVDKSTFSGNSNVNTEDLSRGGALYIYLAGGTISNSLFENNTTNNVHGGAIYAAGSDLSISGTVFDGNKVITASNYHGGAIYADSCDAVITGTTFSGNIARTGGAIYNTGDMSLNGVLFDSNSAAYGGGAVRNHGGTMYFSGVTFSNNTTDNGTQTAMRNQGTLYINGLVTLAAGEKIQNDGTIIVDAAKFLTGNQVAVKAVDANGTWLSGAALSTTAGYDLLTAADGDIYVVNAEAADYIVSNNAAKIEGTDFYYVSDGKGKNFISANTTSDLAAATGEVVVSGYTLSGTKQFTLGASHTYTGINGSVISLQATDHADGAMRITKGSTTNKFSGMTFSGNIATGKGGVLYNGFSGCKVEFKDSVFESNNAATGGVIYWNNAGDLIISGSEFSKNSSNNGGVVYVNNAAANVTISNTEFADNTSDNHGGAIWSKGLLTLDNVSFVENTAVQSASSAIYNSGTITVAGLVTLGANQKINNQGIMIVDAAKFITGNEFGFVKVIDANGAWRSGNAVTVTDGYFLYEGADNDIYVTNAATVDYIVTADGTAAKVADTDLYYVTDGKGGKYIASKVSGNFASATGNVVVSGYTLSGTTQIALGASHTYTGINGALVSIQTADRTEGAFRITKGSTTNKFSGMTFSSNTATGNGGVFYNGYSSGVFEFDNCIFDSNTAGTNGGALYGQSGGTWKISNSVFSNNSAVSSGGALYFKDASNVTVTNVWFDNNSAKYGGAFRNDANTVVTLSGVTFTNNRVSSGSSNDGVAFYNKGTINVSGTITMGSGQSFYNSGTMIIKGADFLGAEPAVATVFDVSSDYGVWNKGAAFTADSGKLFALKDDLFITNADAVYYASTAKFGDVITKDFAAALTAGTSVVLASTYSAAKIEISGTQTFIGINNAAIKNNIVINAGGDLTLTGMTVTRGMTNNGSLTLKGSNTIGGTINVGATIADDAKIVFAGTESISVAALTIGKNVGIEFAGILVKFAALNVEDVAISVDGSKFESGDIIATGVTGTLGEDDIVVNAHSYLVVEEGNLVLKKIDAQITGGSNLESYTGNGLTLMDGGSVGTLFATKGDEKEIVTEISGGKVEQNLVGGAYVSAGNTATVNSVELLIGGTAEVAAKVYAGGYLYGNGAESAEAQLTVKSVNVNIDGGAVSGNLYGGAHARQFGNASVTEVNITVTAGSHGRIYAGGWAEKGAVSSVGTANVTISGGTVDYLYGGGANADGSTTVGTTTITIENSALVNTVFMSGRYGYSSVSDTVTLNYNSTTGMKRLSGVSSAGVDNALHTVVNVLSDLTADLIDYVDKFVISENCTLTANDAFYLGNRLENGETDGFTTFDFIAEGEAEWTAVAGIDDFTNAKFSVNGAGLTTWDGESVKTIGDYTLTYDEDKKTITLANA
ncbi:MAG: hypothetical protein IJW35_07230 [Lentisphaeria bacterium]|nr:hypothetical protein [Lentisphaeria bacterium]